MLAFNFRNVAEAYYELIWAMKVNGVERESRNGPVITIAEPIGVTLTHPEERVIFDSVRDANPFFHLMEAIWMLSGEQDVRWLLQFNKRMVEYAEPDGILRGAYGFRWRYHFNYDQLLWAVGELKRNPESRRVVLSMWDSGFDTVGAPQRAKDLPCNTHIYLRIEYDKLGFTVCNRSNDMIWGMLGANAVHMTILQEVLASAIGVGVGPYTVMTNNLHIYRSMPRFEEIMDTVRPVNPYRNEDLVYPIKVEAGIMDFLAQCQAFVNGYEGFVSNKWLMEVVLPVHEAWFNRTEDKIGEIKAPDWRVACFEWIARRATSSSSTSTEHLPTMIIDPISLGSPEQQEPVVVSPRKTGTSISPSAEATPPSSPSSNSSDSSNSTESESTSSQDVVIR